MEVNRRNNSQDNDRLTAGNDNRQGSEIENTSGMRDEQGDEGALEIGDEPALDEEDMEENNLREDDLDDIEWGPEEDENSGRISTE